MAGIPAPKPNRKSPLYRKQYLALRQQGIPERQGIRFITGAGGHADLQTHDFLLTLAKDKNNRRFMMDVIIEYIIPKPKKS